MFKSKHSGWTWEMKRTPYGGGNPISGITDSISSALGTDGGGGGVLGALADIDPGPAIGSGLAEFDKGVSNVIPGGWGTIGTAVATYFGGPLGAAFAQAVEGVAKGEDWDKTVKDMGIAAGLAYAGGQIAEGLNFAGAEEITSEAGKEAFFQSLSQGASSSDAIAAGLAADTASTLTPEMLAYANASPDPIGSINAIAELTPEEFASYTKIIGDAGSASGFTAGEDLAQLMQSHPDLSQAQLEDILRINYGTDPMLSADAANLAASGYDAATIDQVLGYSYNPTELAGTGIESSTLDASGLGLTDTLKNINRARQLAKLLGQEPSKVNYKIPSSQDWLKNAQQVALNQPAQQQFGGLYEMNKSPFTFQNPLATALAGGNKQPGIYDVSGTQGQALDTRQQNQIYSSLLRS